MGKREVRKLYTFSTPYSQSMINPSITSNPGQQTRTQENDMGYFLDTCDSLGVTTITDRQVDSTSLQNKHARLQMKTTKDKRTKNECEKRKMTTSASAMIVDGLGIAVHQKVSSVTIQQSSKKKMAVRKDKRMMQLKVLGTIFKMKHELDIIRQRRLNLANKQHKAPEKQEE
ncbi:uncharacterized protein LOC132556192 [Ylistrum balloti]|uniref:uncharacterized protein LOC132556192 n=1 Tax=Ylistrum balloti TaxID=509963 RepID=UPI002905B1CE|nr:uncharacterized protein LOC132556192 [Ylistrum balloti]